MFAKIMCVCVHVYTVCLCKRDRESTYIFLLVLSVIDNSDTFTSLVCNLGANVKGLNDKSKGRKIKIKAQVNHKEKKSPQPAN